MPISIEQVLLKAKRFAKNGENQLAAEQYKTVLEAFPNNIRAIRGLKALDQASKGIRQTGLAGHRQTTPTRNQINDLLSLYSQGQLEKALTLGEELASQYPGALMVFNILGAIKTALGELDQAVIAYTKAREIDPNVAEVHNNLGLALNGLKRHEEAVESYQRAVKLKPDYAGAFNNLGLAINDLEKPKEAIDCYLKALKIRPEYAEAYNNIGIAQNNLHLHDKAVISYDKALKINADIAEVHKNKGQALSLMGRNEEALSCFTNVLRLNPDTIDAEVLFGLSSLPPDLVNMDLVSLLDKVVPGPNNPDLNISTAFAKASIFHNAGRYDDAWHAMTEANETYIQHFGGDFPNDMRLDEDFLEVIRNQACDNKAIAKPENGSPVSLFILGPSRSGKSTIESLLTNSPGVKQGYESSILANAVNLSNKEAGLPEQKELFELPAELEARFRTNYLDILKNHDKSARVFTLTSPGNIKYVSRAADILPNVRIIFIKRNLDDLMLRIFMKQYRQANSYAYKLENIRKYIAWYYQLIDVLHNKYPDNSIIIEYDKMIADPETTLQSISNLCGIDLSSNEIPALVDDRGCAEPYRKFVANKQ